MFHPAEGYELTDEELAEFEDLCEQKIKIVDERDELVNQTEEERLRSVSNSADLFVYCIFGTMWLSTTST